jgi:hypothetical protein
MKGGGLDYTVVLIVVVLNMIAYLSVKDWTASIILLFGLVISQMFPYKSMLLFLALLLAALSRSVYVEGMDNPIKIETENKKDKKDKIVALEGLTLDANKLVDKQKDIFAMAKDLGPMMERAESMMDKLPPGFLAEAMKNFNNKKD